jgi:sugar phosphate permease
VSREPSKGPLKRPTGIFYGWWIVTIGLLVSAVKHGLFQRGFSLYFLHLQTDLGVSSSRYSMAETLGRLEGGIQGPVVGYLTDRLGPGALMVAGGAILGLGFILLSFSNSYLYFILVYVLILSLASRAGYENASMAAVNQWFRRKRGLAMAIVSTGHGLGGAAIIPIVTLMLTEWGWRTSALVSGIAILTIVPLCLMVRRSPESIGMLPDGDSPDSPQYQLRNIRQAQDRENPGGPGATGRAPAEQASREPDFTVKEAMRTPSFWLFVIGAVGLRDTVHAGVQWHLARLIVMSGASLKTAGFFIGFMSLCTLVFNPSAGWMGDKWSKQKISAVAMVAGTLALVMLLRSSGHLWELAVFVILLAVAETANPLSWAILGDLFGRKSYATLRGWQQMSNQLMSMSTPMWMGWVFDRTDSYVWALIPLAIANGVSAFFYWTLPKPKPPARASETESQAGAGEAQGP